jgi:hypothetical protein
LLNCAHARLLDQRVSDLDEIDAGGGQAFGDAHCVVQIVQVERDLYGMSAPEPSEVLTACHSDCGAGRAGLGASCRLDSFSFATDQPLWAAVTFGNQLFEGWLRHRGPFGADLSQQSEQSPGLSGGGLGGALTGEQQQSMSQSGCLVRSLAPFLVLGGEADRDGRDGLV